MMDNDEAAKSLYENVGPEWLIEKSDEGHANAILDIICSNVKSGSNILDICCGYGRITIPLVQRGYYVQGVDISEVLIERAIQDASMQGIEKSIFKVGNMKSLPYKEHSFNATYCVWASFNFLLTRMDQLQALNEMFRVLSDGGKAMIEIPYYHGCDKVEKIKVGEIEYKYANISKATMAEVLSLSKFSRHSVDICVISNRRRIVCWLEK